MVSYPALLELSKCSELPLREGPQCHGRKSVVRGSLYVQDDIHILVQFHALIGMDHDGRV